jgi:photosystem II stability/assembly factor-like uncharacterized protein
MFPALLILLSACSLSVNPGGSGANNGAADLGGVFLSTDSGSSFKSQSLTPSVSGKPGNVVNVNVKSLTIDPSDNTAVYMATYGQGLYYTYNILTGWLEVANLPKVTINAVAVNPKNKCDIYAVYANRLMRSVDCTRTWSQTYLDAKPETIFTALAIDSYNPKNIYLGTSNGDILKSIDGGYSWRALKRLEEPIMSITLSPKDTRRIYIITKAAKFYSFFTNTVTNANNSEDIEANFAVTDWSDPNKVLQDLRIGSYFKDLAITPDDQLFLATEQSIVHSPDYGVTWQKMNLLPAEKDAIIKTVAVNPKNNQEIYYATNLTFFKSSDGGVTWSNKKLPTSRSASDILIDYKNPNIVYLGAYREE